MRSVIEGWIELHIVYSSANLGEKGGRREREVLYDVYDNAPVTQRIHRGLCNHDRITIRSAVQQ